MKNLNLRLALAVALTLTMNLPAAHAAEANELWKKLGSTKQDGLNLLSKVQESADRWRLFWINGTSVNLLGDTKEGLREQMDKIMLDAADVLGGSELTDLKNQVNQERQRILKINKELAKISQESLGAPETKSPGTFPFYSYFDSTSTKADLAQQKKHKEDEIARRQQTIKNLRTQFISVLTTKLNLNPEMAEKQADTLLFTINGDKDIQLISAYENLKILTDDLQKKIVDESVIEAKTDYFGIYALLVRALISFHQDYLLKIDGWQKKLDQLKINSQKLAAEAEKDSQTASVKELRDQSSNNVKLNRRTIQVNENYKAYLQASQARVQEGLVRLHERYKIAERTYQTYKNIDATSYMINEIQTTTAAYLSLELPEMTLSTDSATLDALENLNVDLMK